MFRDVVFEEIYGKLIKRIQSEAYLQGSKDGVGATFAVIDEMVAEGIPVTKQSIIDYSWKRSMDDAEIFNVAKKLAQELVNVKSPSDLIEKLLTSDLNLFNSAKAETPTDDTAVTEECTEENSTPSNVVNLFPKK